MADKNKSGDFYNRPEKLGAWAGFKQFLWNSETSQFMGRTSGSWGESHDFRRWIRGKNEIFLRWLPLLVPFLRRLDVINKLLLGRHLAPRHTAPRLTLRLCKFLCKRKTILKLIKRASSCPAMALLYVNGGVRRAPSFPPPKMISVP